MKTKSEMKLEKIKLMKDQLQKGIFHATKAFLVYRQRTEYWEKGMCSNFQNYNVVRAKSKQI